MEDRKLSRLGGAFSILIGVSYLVIGVTYFLQPTELQAGGDPAQFFSVFAQDPLMHTVMNWAFALGAVLALVVVPAIAKTIHSESEGWVRWASNLAFVGFAVNAISYFRAIGLEPTMAADYIVGDASCKAAILASSSLISLDPQYWLGFGGVGLWILVVSLMTLRMDEWPTTLSYVGIAGAILYWLVVAGTVLKVPLLVAISAGVGGVIVAPIWYIWVGLKLRGSST